MAARLTESATETGRRRPPLLTPSSALRAFEDSRALAALRIVVTLLLLVSPELHQAGALAAHPERLNFVPEGAHWLAALHLTPSAVQILRLIALSSGALALLGFHSRLALALLTAAALPLYALSQFGGTVLHDMHLFWFSALLALSPCSDVWALDSWGQRPARHALSYAIPAGVCRALLGVVYFFPGFHKLLESGWSWGAAPQVVAQMHAKWFELAQLPALRIDHYPWLCSLGGHAVLLFELGFLPLSLWRRTRPLAACVGLSFHFATQIFFFIPFISLWACYVLLVPWSFWQRRSPAALKAQAKSTALPRRGGVTHELKRGMPRAALPALALGGSLLALAVVQGVRGRTQAWPIACYPTFSAPVGDTLPDLLVQAESPEGKLVRFTGRERSPRAQAEWGRVFRISGAYGDPADARALREHALTAAQRAGVRLAPGSTLRVYRVAYATAPERWRAGPQSEILLSEFALDP